MRRPSTAYFVAAALAAAVFAAGTVYAHAAVTDSVPPPHVGCQYRAHQLGMLRLFRGLRVRFIVVCPPAPVKIATVSWQFGDGADGFGPRVWHTFTGTGRFTVIETAIDSAGHTYTATTRIVISG